jgi:hypothetical protein
MSRRIVLTDDEICSPATEELTPALPSSPLTKPTGNIMVDMVQETSAQLMAKTLSLMDTDPEVQQVMREQVLKMVSEAMTVVPKTEILVPVDGPPAARTRWA